MTTRIDTRFAELAHKGRAALVTFLMAGDPDPATSLDIVKAMPAAGADVITANNSAVVTNLLARVGMTDRLEELTRLACQLALEARAANRRQAVRVAG